MQVLTNLPLAREI
ncbi:unnamed protein product, partial [Rotaria magnacalcarata]